MRSHERTRARSTWRERAERQTQRRHEDRVTALLDAAEPTLQLLARDERAEDNDWIFVVVAQDEVDVESAPPEIVAAMRGLCPEEPVVALMPLQKLIDGVIADAGRDAQVVRFLGLLRKSVERGRLKVIVFTDSGYELVGVDLAPLPRVGEA